MRESRVQVQLDLSLQRCADVPFVSTNEIVPLAQLRVIPLERKVRLLVVGIDLEHLLQPPRREIRLEEVLFLKGGELRQKVDSLALGRDHVELALEDTHEVRPLLEELVDPPETAKGLKIARIDLDDLPIDLGPLGRIGESGFVERGYAKLGRCEFRDVGERRHLPQKNVGELPIL